jgi:TonB family protein
MKHLLPLLLLSSSLFAQVYLKTAGAPVVALPNNHPLVAEAYKNFIAKVEQNPIRIPDSIVVKGLVKGNKIKDLDAQGVSINQNQNLINSLNAEQFGQLGAFELGVVVPALSIEPLEINDFDEYPKLEYCKDFPDANQAFFANCFAYHVAQFKKLIELPKFYKNPNLEGPTEMELHIGVDGRVRQVSITNSSFNPELNDFLIQQFQKLKFPEGPKKNGKAAAYKTYYSKDFFNFDAKSDYQKILASKKNSAFEKVFWYNKSKSDPSKPTLDSVSIRNAASAFLAIGDTDEANGAFNSLLSKELQQTHYYRFVANSNPENWELVEKTSQFDKGILHFGTVEVPPVFPGCENEGNPEALRNCFSTAVMRHVSKNFHFPELAKKSGATGKVFVNFYIEKDGSIHTIEILRGVHPALDIEVIRVVSTFPKMTSAQQKGEPIRISYVLPINAKIM